jgi:hypothetical protein
VHANKDYLVHVSIWENFKEAKFVTQVKKGLTDRYKTKSKLGQKLLISPSPSTKFRRNSSISFGNVDGQAQICNYAFILCTLGKEDIMEYVYMHTLML